MITFLAAAAVAASNPCPLEKARYSLRTASSVTAYFSRTRPDDDRPFYVAFATHFGASDRTFWWVPVPGGTSGLQYVQSTTDVHSKNWRMADDQHKPIEPLGEMEFVSTDIDYNLIEDLPRMDKVAPAHILLTRLNDAMWHDLFVLDGTREVAPTQFFDLVSCASR